MTAISEVIEQTELNNAIDLLFDTEIKDFSKALSVPIYYFADEHSFELYEVFVNGESKKRLEFSTHSSESEFCIDGKIAKQSGPFALFPIVGSLIDKMELPLDLDKKDIFKIIKRAESKKIQIYEKKNG